MGNIVTPEQGLLPIPPTTGMVISYPWWLNTALAIWAILALVCCWLLLLLYLLRYCCRWCRHRKYATARQSLRERFFDKVKGRRHGYFETSPSPPIPVYSHFYGSERPYTTTLENQKATEFTSDNTAGHIQENIQTNVERNITKNFYINEEQNYFVNNEASQLHNTEVQKLPGLSVTTINMAAERIAENPIWENASMEENFNDLKPKHASSELVISDPSLFQQDVKYEPRPNIYIHRSVTSESLRSGGKKKLGIQPSLMSHDGSVTSEMSGHDSETIYETIRVFTPRKQALTPLEDDDDGKTAGVDEVEFEIKELVRQQMASMKTNQNSSSIGMSQQPIVTHASSISSSSTLNNAMPDAFTSNQQGLVSGEEEKEETVTETIKTQQIQTTYHPLTRNAHDSAFFIPLPSSSTITNPDETKIIIPISQLTTSHEEKPALEHF